MKGSPSSQIYNRDSNMFFVRLGHICDFLYLIVLNPRRGKDLYSGLAVISVGQGMKILVYS